MNTKFLFGVPLGTFCDSRRFEAGTALAGIALGLNAVSQGANVVQSNMSSHQSRELARWQTNQNLALSREQMAANRKAFEDAIAEQRYIDERNRSWQLQDTASQRAYDSASAVAQRYRDAGINPYLAMISGAAGQMSGTGVSPNMSQGHSPTGSVASPSSNVSVTPSYAPLVDFGRGINEAFANFFQARATEQGIRKSEFDIEADKLRLRMEEAESVARINKLENDGLLSKNEADKVRYDLDFLKKVEGDRIKEFSLRNDEIAANIAYTKAETEFTNVQAEFARHNIKLTDMQIKRLKTLLPYEASLMAQQAVVAASQANYYNTSAADINNTFDARLRGLKSDAKLKIAQALNIEGSERRTQEDFDNVWKHYIEPILGETIQAIGIGVGLWRGGAASAGRATQTVEHVQDKPFRYYDEHGDVRQGMNRTTTTTTQRIRRR